MGWEIPDFSAAEDVEKLHGAGRWIELDQAGKKLLTVRTEGKCPCRTRVARERPAILACGQGPDLHVARIESGQLLAVGAECERALGPLDGEQLSAAGEFPHLDLGDAMRTAAADQALAVGREGEMKRRLPQRENLPTIR